VGVNDEWEPEPWGGGARPQEKGGVIASLPKAEAIKGEERGSWAIPG